MVSDFIHIETANFHLRKKDYKIMINIKKSMVRRVIKLLLEGKTAIVTGGAGGIGEAIVHEFLEEGARVIIADIKEEDGKRLEKELKSSDLKFINTDVSKKEQVKNMVDKTLSINKRIDILINCAAIAKPGLMVGLDEEDWDKIIDVNLKGCFLCSQAVAKAMIDLKSGGKIINISSMHARISFRGASAYVASKGGVEALTKTMARELGPFKIHVNALTPGAIITPMTEPYFSKEFKDLMMKRIVLKEFGTPKMIADVVTFLVSDKSYYINGQNIVVDGGFMTDGYPVDTFYDKLD